MGAISALSAGASIVGGFLGSDSADDAADAQIAAANAAIDNTQAQISANDANVSAVAEQIDPFAQVGTNALKLINQIIKGKSSPEELLVQTPNFQFVQDELNENLTNVLKAQGNFFSGNAVEEFQDRNANLASNEFANFVNLLLNTAGIGQNATAQKANLITNQNATNTGASNTVAQLFTNAGNAEAQGELNSTAALVGGFTNPINSLAALGAQNDALSNILAAA